VLNGDLTTTIMSLNLTLLQSPLIFFINQTLRAHQQKGAVSPVGPLLQREEAALKSYKLQLTEPSNEKE
jgi:hypothetical protein